MHPASPNWNPPVVMCSGLTGVGLDALWAQVELHRNKLTESGELPEKRRRQQVQWMWSMVEERLLYQLRHAPAVRRLIPKLERDVREGALTATLGAERILEAFEQ
jgi:LAO/AO transport system kinase